MWNSAAKWGMALILVASVPGCGGDGDDGDGDAGLDAGWDAGRDGAVPDAGPDGALVDAGPDGAPPDAGPDVDCDVDGDEYESPACGGTDCDDANATVNPGATELCDRLDTDCSEGGGTVPEEDADGDRHAPEGTLLCSGGYPADDCRDSEPDVYTGQTRYFSEGYCVLFSLPLGQCIAYSWDYDCDGEQTPQPPSTGCVMQLGRRCVGSGPVYSGDPPTCGTDVDYRSCALRLVGDIYTCTSTAETRGMPCR